MDHWVTDEDDLDPRFPAYTRANADEVGPEPISPLGWTLVFARAVNPGGLESWIRMGVLSEDERRYDPRGIALFGGYMFNNLSLARVFGARMPGGDVEQLDRQSFGDRPDMPPYEPHPEDEDPDRTAALGAYLGAVMEAGPLPELDELWAASVDRRRNRPDHDALSEAELLEEVRAVVPAVEDVWKHYIYVSVAASIGPGALQAVCGALGRPEIAPRLISGVGNVVSARAPQEYWRLGRRVASSEELTQQFDRGLDGLEDRLRTDESVDAARFLSALDTFLTEEGHRGPNEWDLRSRAWEDQPDLVLGLIDRLRHQGADHDPSSAAAAAVADRERLVAEIAEAGEEVAAQVGMALHAAQVWLARRELAKDACIRFVNESRIAARALGRRCAARGGLRDAEHVFMLEDAELDRLVAGDGELGAEAAARVEAFASLGDLEPPYFVDVRHGVPPLTTWKPRTSGAVAAARPGDVLHGLPGAPGTATGRARVVLDPFEFGDLEPTDIAVVQSTDPSWTPLFLSVAGVVSDRGATISHATITSRELGIPCVVSCHGATQRIADGTPISIDGATGEVVVLDGRPA